MCIASRLDEQPKFHRDQNCLIYSVGFLSGLRNRNRLKFHLTYINQGDTIVLEVSSDFFTSIEFVFNIKQRRSVMWCVCTVWQNGCNLHAWSSPNHGKSKIKHSVCCFLLRPDRHLVNISFSFVNFKTFSICPKEQKMMLRNRHFRERQIVALSDFSEGPRSDVYFTGSDSDTV